MSSPSDQTVPPPDEDITIPRAAMNKMIKELCPNIRVQNEAREMILNCCTEFIHLLSSESNEMCNNQQKKTISAEHVLQELILAEKTSFNGVSSFFSHLLALESLDFSDFKKDCEEVLNECKDVAAKRRRQSTRLEHLGIPEEELLRQQQELFARARAAAAEQDLQLQQQMSQSVAAAGQQPASSSAAATGHSGQS